MHHGPIDSATARGLKLLRDRIAKANVPSSKIDETLLIATWNVRELGKHPRLPASLHYLAEVIGTFDLVCLVEVRDDIDDLAQIRSTTIQARCTSAPARPRARMGMGA